MNTPTRCAKRFYVGLLWVSINWADREMVVKLTAKL